MCCRQALGRAESFGRMPVSCIGRVCVPDRFPGIWPFQLVECQALSGACAVRASATQVQSTAQARHYGAATDQQLRVDDIKHIRIKAVIWCASVDVADCQITL
jgi:hypothetical protein